MALIKNLIPESQYSTKCPYSMTPKGICIHNTANDAPAINERNYMARADNQNEVSFHIAVDDNQAIQCIPFNRNAWHAGDGGSGQGNRNYIALEICYSRSGGERFIKAEKRAAKEVAALLKEYGWNINNVKKHQDFSNKYCPHRTLDMGWQRFLNMVQIELNNLNINQYIKEEIKVDYIIQYSNSTDQAIAEIMADRLNCPTINCLRPYAFYGQYKTVIAVGEAKNKSGYTNVEIKGANRKETLDKAIEYCEKLGK
ncbi:peptidoglycan recognition protein family protein [Clostridium tertium]|uniref:peptidoglycan recognition protein family protein n=1 Tax=Clostridium tertium TaxID=1559 RepID=UPI0024748D4F|nr:N-acetylmuramoyl-L-alanine amidase [Clostridium tertium]MBP1869319.1 N-acetylmuramoyl-L-alanine amidase CwlA [Clostridium tertium]